MLASIIPPSPSPTSEEVSAKTAIWKIFLAALIIALAALVAYRNTFQAPFVFDDQAAIIDNTTIRGSWWAALSPPSNGEGVDSRPLVNLSLAVNYTIGGLDVRSYHELNLLIHILAGLTLFGVARRTLQRPLLGPTLNEAALPLAFTIALLWTIHPLLTETVTCVVQRNEAMMALFYFLALYCFIRASEVPRAFGWQFGAVLACFLGVASKEVMVTLPLLALLYDRAFVAGTFREAVRQHWKLYAGLLSSWSLLAYLMLHSTHRGDTVGFGLVGQPWWTYTLKQCDAIIHYLQLCFWPHPLVLDYGTAVVTSPLDVLPQGILLAVLLTGAFYAFWRKPKLGFAGAWFFLILAPSSSIVPLTTQTVAEHRMYLPLAAVISLAVLGSFAWLGRRTFAIALIWAGALATLTFQRNEDYRSLLSIWDVTTATHPEVARAHENVANSLFGINRLPESLREYETACLLKPGDAEFEDKLGNALAAMKQPESAAIHFAIAAQRYRRPTDQAMAYFNLGVAWGLLNRWQDALNAYDQATKLNPQLAEAFHNLGNIWSRFGHNDEALAAYKQALKLQPNFPLCENSIGLLYVTTNHPDLALPYFTSAARHDPHSSAAFCGLGDAYTTMGKYPEAVPQYLAALKLQPDFVEAHTNLGVTYLRLGQTAAAIAQFTAALQINPDLAAARNGLNLALQKQAASPASGVPP